MPRKSEGPQLRANPKKGGIWYIYWTESRGARSVSRERSTGTRDSAEAHRVFAEWLDAGGGTPAGIRWDGPRRAAQATIADVLAVYAQEHAANHTAAPERTGYAIAALLGFWGERTCDYIKPETCRAYVKTRMSINSTNIVVEKIDMGVSEATAARELTVLRAALGYAADNGKLVEDLRRHVELPSKPPGRDRWLTRSEAARLLWESRKGYSRDYLPLFIMLALRTGARPGALFDLTWAQIDFQRGRIDFNPPGRKRTNKGRPIIPIPRRLRWFLLKAQQRATSPYVIAFRGKKIADIGVSFMAAAKRAGLGRDVLPYTMRHTAATWMMHRAVPINQVAGWLGHSIQKTTELYSHHSPDHFEQARKVMD